MSDYTNQNQGIGGKGIVVALVLIAGFFVLLAFLGSNTVPDGGTPAPAGVEEAPVAPLDETAPAPIK